MSHIHYKGHRNRKPTEKERAANHARLRMRARVEDAFDHQQMLSGGVFYEVCKNRILEVLLTRSARPITLYLMLTMIFVMIFGNIFGTVIEDKYVDLVQILTMTAFSFYFGGKIIEAFKHGKLL